MPGDVVIVGAGHNALAAAFYLARAGRRPVVLERRAEVGGGAATVEIHPGFRVPRYSHEVLLDERVQRDMNLTALGVVPIPIETRVCAPAPEGPPLRLLEDAAASVDGLHARHPRDASAYAPFHAAVAGAAAVIGTTFDAPPPDLDHPAATDLWSLLKAGRRFRALPRRERFQLLRWLTMPVGDLLAEWFADPLLQAVLAGPGLSGTSLGPRSAGSALVLLLREASRLRAGGRALRVRGGPGALTAAMREAAVRAGAEIQTNAAVERILVRDGRVAGIVVNGEELACRAIVSGLDPATTFLSLLDPAELDPDFAMKIRHVRARGTVAKVNLALSALPTFTGVSDPSWLAGRVHVGPEPDYLEQAYDHVKYGEMSAHPWLDITIPSIADSDLAPPGAHVMSIAVHYAPFALRGTTWEAARDVLLSRTLETLESCAPDVAPLIVAADVVTPADLQRDLGLTGGHIFHGELAPDQLFTMRPLLGHARYDSPIHGLHLCGAGTHPGGFMTGTSGRLAAGALRLR